MLLAFKCQDCGEVETHDVDRGSVAETLEWWLETVLDYLCEPCERRLQADKRDRQYSLD